MVKKIALFAVAATLAAAASAAPKKAAASAAQGTLAAGEYTAHVAMLACSECSKNVEKVLNGTKGIESA